MKLCFNCPENAYVPAVYKYNQLQPMCELHYKRVIDLVEAFCDKVTNKERHLLKNINKIDIDLMEKLSEWNEL